MKTFNQKTHSFVDPKILETIKNQQKQKNPLINKIDSIEYSSVSPIIREKVKKIISITDNDFAINRISDPIIIESESNEDFILKHCEEMKTLHDIEETKKENLNISNGKYTQTIIPGQDLQYLISGDETKLPKSLPQEPIYKISKTFFNKFLPQPKIYKVSFINKIISQFKNNYNKLKIRLLSNLFIISQNISKFFFLKTLSKKQRQSLKNMNFNFQNLNENSAIVKLILSNKIDIEYLRKKQESFNKAHY